MKIASREVEERLKLKHQNFGNSWLKRKSFAKRLNYDKLDVRLRNLVMKLFHSPTIYRG